MSSESFSWRCPFCNHDATITKERLSVHVHDFNHGSKYAGQRLQTIAIICPNPECKEYVIKASLHDWVNGYWDDAKQEWQLIPAAEMKVFPTYIPAPILADYKESCLIRHLSPKASATLARRCLQGMIRDFWGVSKARLVDEIEAIEQKVDPLTWSAIDAVRKIGNIGAHMEKDINLIIDVDPEEAALLIGLIEMLINDWYIVKHEREQQLTKIISVAGAKTQAKTGLGTPPVTSSGGSQNP
jgi:hypothetical protein